MKQKNFLKIVFLTIFFTFSFQAQTINDNFEDGDLSGWTEGTVSDWINSTSTPLTGTRSLKHNLTGVSSNSYIYHDISSLDLTTQNISWQFNLKNSGFDPSSGNKFWVYLTANETNLNGGTVDGYAVGVNLTGSSDLITLWKVTNGTADGAVITSSIDWGTTDLIGIKVTRSSAGLWELIIDNDENGVFDNLTSHGTATNTDYTFDDYFGLSFTFTSSNAGDLRMDDVTVEGTTPSTDTTVSFNSATSTVSEDGTSIDICVGITNPDASTATTVEVALNGESTTATNPGDYTPSSAFTTTLTFPANSSADQCITINLTDDSDSESNELLVLDLQNAAGGSSATLGVTTQHTLTITDDDLPNIIINEILADPVDTGSFGVDSNGDGVLSGDDDEFIELVNLDATPYDLTDYTISDSSSTRYTFGAVTIPAGGSVVVFGGGTPTAIPGLSFTTSTLSLGNSNDVITLRNSGGTTIASYDYAADDSGDNQSIARSDDSSAGFVKHTTIGTNPVKASPGRKNVSNLPFNILTWAGTTNDWETDSNWSSGSKPTNSDDVIIPTGLSFYPTIEAGVNAAANTISIASGTTLKIEETATLTAGITYNRTLTNGGQWYFMSAPVIGETYDLNWTTANSIPASSKNTNNIGINTYDNTTFDIDTDGSEVDNTDTSTGNWSYLQSDDSNSDMFNKGQGYGVIRSGSGTVSFLGSGLYTATQEVGITQGASTHFNMVGNPFTAYLNLGDFFTDNGGAIITGASAYFWNGSGYDTRTSSLHSSFEIAPGQGFFVEAAGDVNLTFDINDTNHLADTAEGSDTFQKNTRPEIHLFLSDGKNKKYANIYYIDGTTTGFDNGYDGKLFGGVAHSFALYSHLVTDSEGENYQLQSLPNSNHENMIIPIGINAATNKEITFSTEVLNLPENINVYLEDKLNNTFTRLDELNSNYKVTLTEKVNGIGRFYLHTSKSVPLNINRFDLENISIYKTNNSNLRIVGLSNGKANVKLFNILGKQVLNTNFSTTGIANVSIPQLSKGIYIIQLETEKGTLNKKITLE